MKGEIDISVIQRLVTPKSSKKIIFSALKVFKITRKNFRERTILLIFAFIPAVFVGVTSGTQAALSDATQTILDVVLAMFGIVFTGYSFFQALINQELLIRMVENTTKNEKGEEISKLQETNESFVECMILVLFSILLSLLLKIIASCIDEKFNLFNQVWKNDVLAVILIYIYFSIIAIVLWEIKSFIFNVFQLFSAYAGTEVLEIIKRNTKQ